MGAFKISDFQTGRDSEGKVTSLFNSTMAGVTIFGGGGRGSEEEALSLTSPADVICEQYDTF